MAFRLTIATLTYMFLNAMIWHVHDLVTRGVASAFKPNFCPWCFCHKKHFAQVDVDIGVDDIDTMSSISNQWRMSKTLL